MNQSVVDVLKAVRTRLATPERWTQGKNARNGQGEEVEATAKNAVCWCLDGATQVEAGQFSKLYLNTLICLNQACQHINGKRHFFDWQDEPTRTHAEVLDLIDRTIAIAEATS